MVKMEKDHYTSFQCHSRVIKFKVSGGINMKKLISLIIVILLLIVSSCNAEVIPKIKKITFPEKSYSLAPGTYVQLNCTMQPDGATVSPLKWSSSNEKVAIVNDRGIVKGLKKGNTKITATATDGGKAKASVTIKVEQFDFVFVSKRPQKLKYSYTGTGRLKISTSVKNGNVSIPRIETDSLVSATGASDYIKITPVSPGTDTITLNFNGKKTKYKIFIADYFAEYDTQYFPIADTSPKPENGSFQDIIYGTPYSEIKDQLTLRFGNNYTINEYNYGFQIIFNNPEITVAGHDVESIKLEFCYDEDQQGYITKDEEKTCFYRGEYCFSSEPDDNIAENLHLKLNDIYGQSAEELYRPEHIQKIWGSTDYSWSDNNISITLKNNTSLTLSYLWGNGFSKRQTLQEINEYFVELEEKKEMEAEQSQYNLSTDGL